MTTAYTGPMMMFQHCLDELKGWPDESALDYDAFLAPSGTNSAAPAPPLYVNVAPVYGGACVHVNSLGQFVLGVGPTDMAIFLLQGSQELDVGNPGGNNWTPIAPTGKMSGLVATGAYELETTEFDPTVACTTFLPGMQLTSPLETAITGTDLTSAGKLFAQTNWPGGTAGTAVKGTANPVCAVASRIGHINHNKVPVVSFWPVYVPLGG
jgi:hypothetical protein